LNRPAARRDDTLRRAAMVLYDTRSWLGILLRWHGTVVPRIAARVAVTTAIAIVAVLLQRRGAAHLAIPTAVHTLVGVALGLLLVFRTNASYDRFWEGRRLVGAIVNQARNLVRQLGAYVDEPAARAQTAHVLALYGTIRRYLRGERAWPELERWLSPSQRAALASIRCPPLQVARWISDGVAAEARAGRISEQRLMILDNQLSALLDAMGGCERILRTPVPFAYAHHIKGFLTLFCFTVPLALLDSMGLYTPLAAAIVAYALFGIDEIGVEIEDPFGYDANDLPLDVIGDNLAIDLEQLVSPATGVDQGAGAASA
jgi:putative membrane protein